MTSDVNGNILYVAGTINNPFVSKSVNLSSFSIILKKQNINLVQARLINRIVTNIKFNKIRKSLRALLELDGISDGYWVKFSVIEVEFNKHRPHGIKYSLTMHNKYGNRLVGYDNAHLADVKRKKFSAKRVEWDHKHNRNIISDYDFINAGQLIEDFWNLVDQILNEEGVEL